MRPTVITGLADSTRCMQEEIFGQWLLNVPGGGDSHMKQTGMLVGNFEFNP